MDIKDILIFIGTYLIAILQFTLSNTITLIIKSHQNYPDLTNFIFFLVGLYLFYKFLIKSIKTWYNFLKTTIKLLIVVFFIFLVFIIYLRGWDQFKNNDIPFIKNLSSLIYNFGKKFSSTTTNNESKDDNFSIFKNLGNLGSFINQLTQKNVKHETFDESLDDSQAYLNYIRNKFGDDSDSSSSYGTKNTKENLNYEKLVDEGLNYLKDNVNINDVANNLQDILNRFQ
ncbi:uncharacterized protein KGF55_003832 [Candida pseudojiufengensis]|uniref:uncharacterized protein n=1 Tax=Candida pseudojiufengensis TaxID=497109 RepID=UPI002225B46B|nr:uncharacterized protein KGF55_003832 [Candida pseudojiufengensis]KAI5961861.1 hypothetical protein KGF55_003832 [Candida pseudojiufengensis]